EAGLGDPPLDWTWDDMREYAKRLTRREGDEVRRWGLRNIQGNDVTSNAFLIPLVRSFGGDVFSEDGLSLELASPVSSSAVQWFPVLTLEDQVAPPADWIAANGGGNAMIIDQKVAMILDLYSMIMNLRAADVSFDWDVAQVPTGPAGRVNRAAGGVHAIVAA